jgi:hypothetical protein
VFGLAAGFGVNYTRESGAWNGTIVESCRSIVTNNGGRIISRLTCDNLRHATTHGFSSGIVAG